MQQLTIMALPCQITSRLLSNRVIQVHFYTASAMLLALAFLFACCSSHKTVTLSDTGGDSISKITFTYSFPLVKADEEKRLFKISLIYNAQEYQDQKGFVMPKREFLFEVLPRAVN